MSRHNHFYNELKSGAYDDYGDDDEYYEDEEEYYDQDEGYDEYDTAAPSPAGGKGASKQRSKKGVTPSPDPQQSKQGATDSHGVSLEEPDYDFIAQVFGQVRAAVGPMIPTSTIVDALRAHAYNASESIKTVKANKGKGAGIKKPAMVLASSQDTSTLMMGGRMDSDAPSSSAVSSVAAASSPTSSTKPPTPAPAKLAPSIDYKDAGVAKDTQGKEGLTIVITGHVDSGKSTILGHLLLQRGYYSNNDVRKNEAAGNSTNKGSFKYAWLLDSSEEERRRGVTIDSGAHGFETETKRVTVLDAPGHIDFITNMISSATQADAALLVVTVRNGEFESGLEKGTREHLIILHTLGIKSIIVAMNKMDTVDFSQERFDEVRAKLMVEVIAAKYEESNIKAIIPVSGLLGINLVTGGDSHVPWYSGPSLFEAFDAVVVGDRFINSPTRISVQDVQRNVVYGRIESGSVKKGDKLLFIPSNTTFSVKSITLQAGSLANEALAGTSVEITMSDEPIGISAGDVACSPKHPVPFSNEFEAKISVFPAAKKALLPGSRFLLCIHATVVSATITALKMKRTSDGRWIGGMVKSVVPDSQAIVRIRADRPLALEKGEGLRALGVFVMRQDDETIGGGIVQEVLPVSF